MQRRRIREREGVALVEGLRAITTALEFGARLRLLLVDADHAGQLHPRQFAPVRTAAERVVYAASPAFNTVAETEHPQPLIAVCAAPRRAIAAPASLVIALDGVRDPGNLGTLVRAALAAGCDGLALLPGNVDPFNGKAVRASAGAVFGLPVVQVANLDALVASCFAERPAVVVADAAAERLYDDINWTAPTLLVLGGEAAGVGNEARTYADTTVSVPMAGGVESLNAAVAGAVLLFEAARQRRATE